MGSTGSNSSGPAPERADAVEVVVGITSDHDAGTAGAVARALHAGVAGLATARRARFVLADAGSADGTVQSVRDQLDGADLVEVTVEPPPAFGGLPYHGRRNRAAALKAIFEEARRLQATACIVVDAGLSTVRPEWVDRLAGPILDGGADYVSAYYQRQAHRGALTKAIVYPMVRAMYGVRLRQPAAAEFGCSGRLVAHYLREAFWEFDDVAAGVDLWLTTAALAGGFLASEADLGAQGRPSAQPIGDLATILAQVVGALFTDVEFRVDVWQRVRGSRPVPFAGGRPDPPALPPLDPREYQEAFLLGYRELGDVWTWILPPRTLLELRKLAASGPAGRSFDDQLWAGIVYDFAVGHGLRVLPRDQLLRSLAPLYAGWLAWFIAEMGEASPAQADARVEQVCAAFEATKRHLISRWRWPERLR